MSSTTNYTIGEQVTALAAVVILAGIAGCALGLLGGYQFPNIWPFRGYKLKPVLKVITIPSLVAMIIMGAIVRNLFPQHVMNAFPDSWASTIRNMCLAILLIRGGLQVTFSGKGVIVAILCIIP